MSSQPPSPSIAGSPHDPNLLSPSLFNSIYRNFDINDKKVLNSQLTELAQLYCSGCFLGEVLRILTHYAKDSRTNYSDQDLPLLLAASIAWEHSDQGCGI